MNPTREDLHEWAHAEAERLRQAINAGAFRGMAAPIDAAAQTAPSLDFLDRYAAGSGFATAAHDLITRSTFYTTSAVSELANLLDRWVDYERAGMASGISPAAQARVAAATDLMEQVQQLIDERSVHPAAPVMLAGAALEELLRSLVIRHAVAMPAKPGIQAYAEALRKQDRLSPQDVKDITSWAGQRNDAAHGHFDRLSSDRAQLMVDSINYFMRQQTPVTTS